MKSANPPINTQAMLTLVPEPSVIAKSVGNIPVIIVIVVMRIGFSLVLPDSIIASLALRPRSIRVSRIIQQQGAVLAHQTGHYQNSLSKNKD